MGHPHAISWPHGPLPLLAALVNSGGEAATRLARKLLWEGRGVIEERQMAKSPSEQDQGALFRESRRQEGLAREAERQAGRQGDYAEADYLFAIRWVWRDKATTLPAGGGDEQGEPSATRTS